MYFDERKPGWLLSAIVSVFILLLSMLWRAGQNEWMLTASQFGLALAAVFGLSALYNLGRDAIGFAVDNFHILRKAMSLSIDAEILKNARSVHPETIRMIFGERQRAWMLKAGMELPEGIEPYAVLYARPDVTEYFLWYFLRNSSNYRCMAKHGLSDKSHRFDPLNIITDYEQYDQLVSYFQQRNILTQASASNETPLWLPPWTPALVAEDFNLEWDEEALRLPNLAETEGE